MGDGRNSYATGRRSGLLKRSGDKITVKSFSTNSTHANDGGVPSKHSENRSR